MRKGQEKSNSVQLQKGGSVIVGDFPLHLEL